MRRILSVDDNRHIRFAIGAWLERCGFRLAVADGGADGLAVRHEANVDLMLVNVLMPDMRGFESIRK